MAVDTIQFVDSIASSPTVRLDINDGSTWRTTRFEAPPPRLRRAVSQNAMRDGINVSSSQYDARTITLGLTLVHTSEDNKATELQKLARELDRADNFLRYQPTGATKPVFFRLFRSDMSQLEQFTGTPSAIARPTIELLAEPFFLGLRETLGPFTVNNDPAAGSNGLFVDLTGVIGDIAAPPVIEYSGGAAGSLLPGLVIGQRWGASPYPAVARQAESLTLGTDTTSTADASFSAGNKARCSFATDATMATRVSGALPAVAPAGAENRGTYRVFARVAQTVGTAVVKMRAGVGGAYRTTVTLASQTAPQLVELGLYVVGEDAPDRPGYGVTAFRMESMPTLTIQAERTSGTGNLDIDYIAVVPADQSLVMWGTVTSSSVAVMDAVNDAVHGASTPFGATPGVYYGPTTPTTGGMPEIPPGDSRLLIMVGTPADLVAGNVISTTLTVSVHYWPRYLFMRPSAS